MSRTCYPDNRSNNTFIVPSIAFEQRRVCVGKLIGHLLGNSCSPILLYALLLSKFVFPSTVCLGRYFGSDCNCSWSLHILKNTFYTYKINEPRREKTGFRGFRPGLTQTDLYSHRRELDA